MKPMKILAVSGTQEMLTVLTQYLSLKGHQVEAFKDGPEALEKLGREFDVFLINDEMLSMDCFELARSVKGKTDIPVIIISGRKKEDYQQYVDALLSIETYCLRDILHWAEQVRSVSTFS